LLVLDPEPVVRSVVTAILQRAGYAVDEADTVQSALRLMTNDPPELLLTNIYLPGVPARDAIQVLKAVSPKLRVLMMSGLPDEEVIQEYMGECGFDIFPKPFKAEELVQKVRAMLAG
jgi:DNA-binding response OmpR family regulator